MSTHENELRLVGWEAVSISPRSGTALWFRVPMLATKPGAAFSESHRRANFRPHPPCRLPATFHIAQAGPSAPPEFLNPERHRFTKP